MPENRLPPGFDDVLGFGLVEALLGRRSRRFFRGAHIPDGVFAYRSRHPPLPLTELERLLVVAACGGRTGWIHLIRRADRYAPKLSNYSAAAGGRTFPSAAGFHTSRTFFTDDEGVYVLDASDGPPTSGRHAEGDLDPAAGLDEVLAALRGRVRRLAPGRLGLPPRVPHVEPHNTWVVNQPGTLLVAPVADLAQHVLLAIAYLLQNGAVVVDDLNGRSIPGLERFADLYDTESAWPLSFLDQTAMAEVAVELATACYAGALMLQAVGLGGWLFDGIDPFAFLGASADPDVTGLGFRADEHDDWPFPNPTGLPGVMEGHCPPHFPDMRAAVDAVCRRKFGRGGPYHPETPGPYRDTPRVRGAASVHDERFRQCVALQAQYVYDTFGKFPATVPSIFVHTFLQAHHLDLEFYDRFFEPGAYLRTHAHHLERWHPRGGGRGGPSAVSGSR